MSEIDARSLDYFMSEEHSGEFDKLTEEQQAILMNGGTLELGDTGAQAQDSATPGTESTEGESKAGESAEAAKAEEAKPAAAEPVVQAKDGIHTIPYSVLEAEREKARQLEATVAQLQADMAKAKEADEQTGGTEAQEAVLAEYSGEFPEVAADMKPFIQAMISAGIKEGVAKSMAEIEERVSKAVKPLEEASEKNAQEAHFDAIRTAHKDFDTIVSGDSLEKWIETKPSFMQQPLRDVMAQGSTQQVIELFDAYKADNKPAVTGQPQDNAGARKAAEDAIAKAQGKAPSSLSDFPGAGAVHTDEAEALLNASPAELERRFAGKSAEQIMAIMQRVV